MFEAEILNLNHITSFLFYVHLSMTQNYLLDPLYFDHI